MQIVLIRSRWNADDLLIELGSTNIYSKLIIHHFVYVYRKNIIYCHIFVYQRNSFNSQLCFGIGNKQRIFNGRGYRRSC